MDETVIKLARYYLDADRLEAGETALPLSYEELRKLADDVQDLARVIDQAAEGWFKQQAQLTRQKYSQAAKRAFKAKPAPIFPETIPCQCYSGTAAPCCICSTEERALRAYAHAYTPLEPMTTNQRAWCLKEIDNVEGYDGEEHRADSDTELASMVLDVWTAYCRDKGLL